MPTALAVQSQRNLATLHIENAVHVHVVHVMLVRRAAGDGAALLYRRDFSVHAEYSNMHCFF